MDRTSYGSVISDSFNLFRANWRLLYAIEMVSYIARLVLNHISNTSNSSIINVMSIVSGVVINTFLFTLMFLVIRSVDYNEPVKFYKNMIHSLKRLPRVIWGQSILILRMLGFMFIILLPITITSVIKGYNLHMNQVYILCYIIFTATCVKYGLLICVLIFQDTKKSIKKSGELFKLKPGILIAINLPMFAIGFSTVLCQGPFGESVLMTEVIRVCTAVASPLYAVCLYGVYEKMCGIELNEKYDFSTIRTEL